MKRSKGVSAWLVVGMVMIFGLAMGGCASTKSDTAAQSDMDSPECVPPDKLDASVAAEAGLEEFSCSFKKWEGSETLHFKVALKNTSDQPQRYRVNIFLDNGKAVGGLIPRKTGKGLVEPGAMAEFVYPVKGMAAKPKEVILRVSTISQ